ncbi:hypothetical protein NKI54_35235, partial [Mesorhizobium sp. M0663]|uniref:hypothetical protein n=1 Tax=Mesorhizobium sp. M0663 TaxID=2956981 RepID=UPI003335C5AA
SPKQQQPDQTRYRSRFEGHPSKALASTCSENSAYKTIAPFSFGRFRFQDKTLAIGFPFIDKLRRRRDLAGRQER